MWLLSRPLGILWDSGHLPAQAVQFMVVVGLFSNGLGDCLAERLSMGCDVLVDGKSWQVTPPPSEHDS